MEVVEPSSPTEEEEEEEEHTAEPRPRTRSNPEGAEDRAVGAQASPLRSKFGHQGSTVQRRW
uniref:BRISC and BRCA1 A complex member 1 n=2 Tax=Rhinopithecus TaxID=542827 RepID=A0A2K6MYI7_RHIBE